MHILPIFPAPQQGQLKWKRLLWKNVFCQHWVAIYHSLCDHGNSLGAAAGTLGHDVHDLGIESCNMCNFCMVFLTFQ